MDLKNSLQTTENALVSWAKTFQSIKNSGISFSSLKDFKDGNILSDILAELDPEYFEKSLNKISNSSICENQKLFCIYNSVENYYNEKYQISTKNIVEIETLQLSSEGEIFKPHLVNLISLIICLSVYSKNQMIYIDALQTLIQEEKNQIIELLEKVLKKVKFDEISPLDEISDNNLDDVRERKIMESLDLLQNENTLLKVDFEKVIEENKTLKKRNIELIDQIKNLLSTQDSRLKERTMNYEDIESQNRINESKLIDLQLKLDNKMKTQAKETSNLRLELQTEKCKTSIIPKFEKIIENSKIKLEEYMKKIEDLKQINEELEIFKKTNEHIIYNFEQLKEKCDESINKYIKKIEELENINNELLLKNRELEEKVKENENMIKCLENKTLEIILEQKQGKSKFFSIKNSINLSKSLEISTLKSELKSENSCDFDFQNNQNIISLEEKNDDETKKNEEIKNKENIIENSTKNNVNEIEKLKKVIEKIEKDLESSHLKSSKLCDQNQKFRMESFEMKNFNKKLSDELILIKNERNDLEKKIQNFEILIEDHKDIPNELSYLMNANEDLIEKNRELQNKRSELEKKIRSVNKIAKEEEREKINIEINQIKKKFQYKISNLSKSLENKDDEMKLLISALFEIRKKYEEIMENDYLHNETKKGKETLLQGLTYSSKV